MLTETGVLMATQLMVPSEMVLARVLGVDR